MDESLFVSGLPSQYGDFLNGLWDAQENECRGFDGIPTWSADGAQKPTTLKLRRDVLENLASCEAVRTVAKKAVKTVSGLNALKTITEQAVYLPELVALVPSDYEVVRRKKLQDIVSNMESLIEAIRRDKSGESITVNGASVHDYRRESAATVVESNGDGAYGGAFIGISSGSISIGQIFHDQNKSDARITGLHGEVTLYGLQGILEGFCRSINGNIDPLCTGIDAAGGGDLKLRRSVYILSDSIDSYAECFSSGQTGSLKRLALISSIIIGLYNPYPNLKTLQMRVHEILKRRG